ncbi:MAG: hypothetical protein KDD14_07360 [Saprospiraceae bacterium]|nr:hypothetical protein [Saprospiraceae bacterium]
MNLFCKPDDPIISLLHQELNANISRIPDGRLAPLGVLELLPSNSTKYRTTLPNILARPTDLDVNDSYFQTRPMASISGEKTTNTEASFGLKILQGFLQGFDASLPNLGMYFKDATKVSFSFENVKITWIDNGLLGEALIDQSIDLRNPMTAGFFTTPASKLLCIDAVITSSNFTFNVEESTHDNFAINLEALKKELGQAETKLEAIESGKRTVRFKGKQPLPFAFTCLWLQLNPEGRILAMPVHEREVRSVFGTGPKQDLPKYQISPELALINLD